jgi:hypothetical protein
MDCDVRPLGCEIDFSGGSTDGGGAPPGDDSTPNRDDSTPSGDDNIQTRDDLTPAGDDLTTIRDDYASTDDLSVMDDFFGRVSTRKTNGTETGNSTHRAEASNLMTSTGESAKAGPAVALAVLLGAV